MHLFASFIHFGGWALFDYEFRISTCFIYVKICVSMYEWLTSRWQAIIEPSDELLHSCLQYILWILRTVCAFFVCFVVVESWLIQPVPFRVTSLTLGLLYYCPNTSVATLKNIGKCIRWVHTDHTKMGRSSGWQLWYSLKTLKTNFNNMYVHDIGKYTPHGVLPQLLRI